MRPYLNKLCKHCFSEAIPFSIIYPDHQMADLGQVTDEIFTFIHVVIVLVLQS